MKEEIKAKERDRFNGLANGMKAGDRRAAEEIFNYFSPLIYRFVVARIANKHIAQDLTQDIFVKVVSKIDTFDDTVGSFSSWIWQITRNTLIDHYRDKKEVMFSDIEDAENEFRSYDRTVNAIAYKEVLEEVRKFSEEDQEIFSLYYVSDLPYKDISKITGKSEGALRVGIHRMIKKLKSKINP